MAGFIIDSAQQTRLAERWVRNEDDWSGITDTRERRKIQNRRNQRSRRAKRRIEASGSAQPLSALVPTSPDSTLISTRQRSAESEVEDIIEAIRSIHVLDPDNEHNRRALQQFEHIVNRNRATHTLEISLLPSLSQCNFIRALWANVEVLGLTVRQMDDEALSPFNAMYSHQPEAFKMVSQLPAGLQPTELQVTTLHHPWLDLLPVPEMRDNLFRRGMDSFDEDELCHALKGRVPDHRPGVLVWRDPWDPSGWEITEDFVRDWAWVIFGCWDLLKSTNKWRAKRGQRPLFRLPPGMT